MSTDSNMLCSAEEWNGQWRRWFDCYSKGNPRLGKWLRASYNFSGAKTLEIGAGSGRESLFLSAVANHVTCVDFAPEAVELLIGSGLPENMGALQADAASLPFSNNAFDFTFHKGVWILFADNARVTAMLREQLRVTKRIALAIVQNSRNETQVALARERALNDPLFNIRFFDPEEMRQLAEDVISRTSNKATVRVLKYGNPRLSRHLGFLGPFGEWLCARIYRFLPWSCIECVVLEIDFETSDY